MSDKKNSAYLSVAEHVKIKAPELAELIDDLSGPEFLRNLNIIFLLPDKEGCDYLISIGKLGESMANRERFAKYIRSFMIKLPRELSNCKDASCWKSKDLSNLDSKLVPVTTVEGSKVNFEGGLSAVLATDDFVKTKPSLPCPSVWTLTGDLKKWNLDTKPAPIPDRFAAKQSKKGGFTPARSDTRIKIIQYVQNQYIVENSARGSLKLDPMSNPYTLATLSLLKFLNEIDRYKEVFHDALCVVSFDNIDLYLLLEPFANASEPLIDEAAINEWYEACRSEKFSVSAEQASITYNMILKALKESHPPARCFGSKERSEVVDLIDEQRRSLKNDKKLIGRDCANKVIDSYRLLLSTSRAFTTRVSKVYRENQFLKLSHDELRYVTFKMFCDLECGEFSAYEFGLIVNLIAQQQAKSWKDEKDLSTALIINPKCIMLQIAPENRIAAVRQFVCSTMFFYIPVPDVEYSKMKTVSRPNPSKYTIYNICSQVTQNRALFPVPEGSRALAREIVTQPNPSYEKANESEKFDEARTQYLADLQKQT